MAKGAKGLSPNTLRTYRTDLERFVEWAGNPPIDTISSRQLEHFFNYLQNDFRITSVGTTPITPRKLSAKSVQNTWGAMSTFWKWAAYEFDFPNPFNIPRIKAHTKPVDPISQEVIEQLLKACDALETRYRHNKPYRSRPVDAKRNKAILLVLVDTGVRASELCDMNVRDVDFELNRIFVTGKGDKSRYVYLGRVSRHALWKYLVERFPNAEPPPGEPLFVGKGKFHRLTRNGVRLLVGRLGKQIGVDGLHPHRFRHTFAIQFLRNGGNIFELQQLLGHSSLDMVKNYIRLAQTDLEEAVRRSSPADNWRLR